MTEPTEKMTISAEVERRLRDELLALAERNDRSFSAELRVALRAHILAAYAEGELK